jgi:spermidine/putrescine transport system ATP-binding protein
VADFIGETNLLEGRISSIDNNEVKVSIEDLVIYKSPIPESLRKRIEIDSKVNLSIRPEKIMIMDEVKEIEDRKNLLKGRIENIIYAGSMIRYYISLINGPLIMINQIAGDQEFQEGQEVYIKINPYECYLLTEDAPIES